MTKTTTISSASSPDIVTTRANVAGVATPVFTVTVPDGAQYTLPNQNVVANQLYNGALIVATLHNTAGEVIRDGSLLVGYRTRAAEFTTPIRGIPLQIWADLSTTQQRNAQYRPGMIQACDLNIGPSLTIKNRAQLVFSVESSEVVDWTKSFLEILVEEVNL
ncbi:hypothetical protein ACFFLM_21260 [Deinococcus oregonensis]|uniref:Virion structural protein n=1 Tax=Deinococcus oregonensis TaxID=1805970 RepID=A0ABV6B410_9DEIO